MKQFSLGKLRVLGGYKRRAKIGTAEKYTNVYISKLARQFVHYPCR
jgi:hypothetical protein